MAEHKTTCITAGGPGNILLVEDEEIVMQMATAMLEQMGYTVIQAATPLEAITISKRKDLNLDLVLTDIVMPMMNGKEMMTRISDLHPGVKTLFMSGFTSDDIAQRGIAGEGMHFIQKPLGVDLLHEKICQVMGGTAEAPMNNDKGKSLKDTPGVEPEMMALFCGKAPGYVTEIEEGIQHGHLGQTAFFAHKLKGAAATCYFDEVAVLAEKLEWFAEISDAVQCGILLGQLKESLGRITGGGDQRAVGRDIL